MLITVVENFILFGTLLALAGFALAWMARLAVQRGWWQPQSDILTRLYGMTLAVPPFAAAWLVAASLLPEWWMGEAAFDAAHAAPLHQLHLLSDLTAALEPRLAYATFAFAVAAALLALWSSLRGYVRVGNVVRRLEMNAASPPPEQLMLVEELARQNKFDVGLVMSNYPLSFIWGFGRSKLVLSSGLLHSLTPQELMGVLEHEAAHHLRRDNTVKLLLSVCAHTSVAFPLSRFVLKWRAEQVEMVCDEVATARTSAPLEIAEALVKLRKLSIVPTSHSPKQMAASGFISSEKSCFERRVHRLLAFADALPAPERAAKLARTPLGEAFFATSIFTATLFCLTIFAPLAVHHVTESVIHIIK